jgi:protein TonB
VTATRPRWRPIWLRPTVLAALVAAHGALFATLRPAPTLSSPLDAIPVAVVALGDGAEDQAPQEDVAEPEPQPARSPAEPAATPPLPNVTPEAPLPPEPPAPQPAPTPVKPRPTKSPARPVVRKPSQNRVHRPPQEARQAAHQGAASGAAAGALSHADFAALVAAEINRRKFFPAAAREAQASGSVGVAFTIGPAGLVVNQSITRSSGNAALDGAARAILSALRTPPPPSGRFSASTSIRFQLE